MAVITVVCPQQKTLTRVRPPQQWELIEFKRLGWVNPPDSPQSRLKSHTCTALIRADEAVRGGWPCPAGTTTPRAGSMAAASVSEKIIRGELHSALPQTCISHGCSVLSSSADPCAAGCCCGNSPQREYYILTTPHLLGRTGLKTIRRSMSCHKADLTIGPAQSYFWFSIYDFSLLSAFSTGTAQCFDFTGSQIPSFSPVEV